MQYMRGFFCCVCLVSLVPVLFSLTACGRRGDPVVLSPSADTIIEEGAETDGTEHDLRDVPVTEGRKTSQEEKIRQSYVPSGLIGVYTRNSVVLTWDEILGQDIKLYRVYRSEGSGYRMIGQSATPAYTDMSIEQNREYRYKITSVGIYESPASEEITIKTEMH